LKILHVIPDLKQASGPSAFCVKVCDQLAEEGLDVAILHGGAVEPTSLLPENRKVHLVDDFKFFKKGALPDLVHVHSLWAPVSHAGVSFARRHKIPYVISAHGMLAPWAMKHKWLKKRIAWWLYQKRDLQGAALFHVTAPCEVEWLRGLGLKQPYVLAPLGSDLPDLNNAETQRRRDIKTVLFVGRIYPVKGLMNLVKAWAAVKKSSLVHYCDSSLVGKLNGDIGSTNELMNSRTNERPPWQLVLAGPDQAGHKAELVAEAERLGLTVADVTANELMDYRTHSLLPDIVFTGPVYGADKDALYRMADLFVLPSYTENFGVVVTDALSYGVPVITTKGAPWSELLGNSDHSALVHYCESALVADDQQSEVGDKKPAVLGTNERMNFRTNELARTGRAGWWIDIGAEPLAEALKEAMSLSDRDRHMLGVNGRRLVAQKYTWPAIAATLKKAYESLTESRAPAEAEIAPCRIGSRL